MKLRAAALGVLFTVACSDGQAGVKSGDSVPPPSAVVAGIVDSILPPAEALERFVAGLPRTDKLEGGARTRDELVRRLLDVLETRDTAALSMMVVSRPEYGFLYYPTSVYADKPYALAPDVAWMLNSASSSKGARRLLQRLGGRRLEMTGLRCDRELTEGQNRFWQQCDVSYRSGDGKEQRRRLFHAIMEREGRAKFLGYAGDF